MFVPAMLLRQLYTYGSLRNTADGVRFSIKNRLTDAQVTGVESVRIDGRAVPLEDIEVHLNGNRVCAVNGISDTNPLPFPLRETLDLVACGWPLPEGEHDIEVSFRSKPFGQMKLEVHDALAEHEEVHERVPRSDGDDYSPEIVQQRQAFVEQFTGATLHHLKQFSFDPHEAQGNCEHFTGVAQVPIGFAGPLQVNGEHAQGEFLIPLATSEGALVASYNRGMQALNLSGGVTCTVVDDAMQRAPAFVFGDARAGRAFVAWLNQNTGRIREVAEATSRVARLKYIDSYLASRFVFLRFNFTTGDAAGQNMVSRATLAACTWILQNYTGIEGWYLEANLATDKKASQINMLRTRGKRVTAEAVIKRDVLRERMRVEPEALVKHYQVSGIGSMLAGVNNNGLHSANAITAMFIATGQDVANVAEASAGLIHTEVTEGGDLYLSMTLPSLIVATHGGGTGLPTQRECLELLGCRGKGKVNKLAEIVAGTVLAGELSLAAAISSLDWVAGHEQFGRHR